MLSQSQRPSNGSASRPAQMVCVVDDDTSLLRSLRRLLRIAGFTLETFESAELFLQARQSSPPDCLVLDVHLGAVSGFELHAQMLASGTSVPTIFVTGRDDAATRERARRAGAAAYFPKPFDNPALVSAIEKALGRSSSTAGSEG